MSGPFDAGDTATPITPEERNGLIPTHVTLRHELNELEQQNILDAELWAFARRRNVASEPFLRGLHRRMFNRVWRWAGKYRTTEKNLGIPVHRIQPDLHQFLDDAHNWLSNKTYSADELAVRFHHRLVFIHPFPNGNGRWSRLAADLLIMEQERPRFSWGRTNLQTESELRRQYIRALQAADNHDFGPLIAFARS